MTIEELRSKYCELREQAIGINDKLEFEKRDMSDSEKEEWAQLKRSMNAIDRELELRAMSAKMEEQQQALETRAKLDITLPATPERRAAGAQFRKLIENKVGGTIPIELRATAAATGTAESAAAISVIAQDFIEPLNKGLVIYQLGLRVKDGLTSNVKYPIMPAFEANFVAEKEILGDTFINESALTPAPRRIAVKIPITDLANLQTDSALYNWIMNNLAVAVARTLNRWLLQATPIVTGVYGAMAYAASANAIQKVDFAGAVPTYKELVDMRGLVQGTGAYADGTFAYVMSGAMAATLEATRRFESGDTPILVDGKVGGYPVMLSEYVEATGVDTFNATPKHVGFGRWSDAIVGQFGSMKITVDPYTKADAGITNIVLDSYWSVDLIRKASFVIGNVKSGS